MVDGPTALEMGLTSQDVEVLDAKPDIPAREIGRRASGARGASKGEGVGVIGVGQPKIETVGSDNVEPEAQSADVDAKANTNSEVAEQTFPGLSTERPKGGYPEDEAKIDATEDELEGMTASPAAEGALPGENQGADLVSLAARRDGQVKTEADLPESEGDLGLVEAVDEQQEKDLAKLYPKLPYVRLRDGRYKQIYKAMVKEAKETGEQIDKETLKRQALDKRYQEIVSEVDNPVQMLNSIKKDKTFQAVLSEVMEITAQAGKDKIDPRELISRYFYKKDLGKFKNILGLMLKFIGVLAFSSVKQFADLVNPLSQKRSS